MRWWLVQKLGGEKPSESILIFAADGIKPVFKADGLRAAKAIEDRRIKEGKII